MKAVLDRLVYGMNKYYGREKGPSLWEGKPAGPTAAQAESVCAGLLDVRLAGDAWYHGVLHKKEYIGDALRQIEHEDIPRACRLMYGTTLLALLLGCAVRLLIFSL